TDLSDAVITEGRKEVLRHGTIVAKLFRIMPNKVPAGEFKAANLSEHFFSIYGTKVFLLGLVRSESVSHRTFDHRHEIVSQADFIAGIDSGLIADSRSVAQTPRGHIGIKPDGGVGVARGVARERIESDGGVPDAP